jgi:Na+-driven multidrug efflux pump
MGSFAKELKLYRLKATAKSIALSLRNIGYQCKVGFPAMLGDITMAMLMFVGNRAFMEHAGNDGVGAFGVACYYLPFVFMFGNAVAESAQPIVSYNYGAGHAARVNATLAISCRTAVVGALLSVVAFTMFAQELVNMFIGTADPAAIIAINGFPYFAMGFVFFVLNLVAIGFLQSIERVAPAMMFALLRGVLFMVPCFVLLPELMGIRGIWFAMPLTEAATFLLVVLYMLINRKRLF